MVVGMYNKHWFTVCKVNKDRHYLTRRIRFFNSEFHISVLDFFEELCCQKDLFSDVDLADSLANLLFDLVLLLFEGFGPLAYAFQFLCLSSGPVGNASRKDVEDGACW